jgi:hypothetical protein
MVAMPITRPPARAVVLNVEFSRSAASGLSVTVVPCRTALPVASIEIGSRVLPSRSNSGALAAACVPFTETSPKSRAGVPGSTVKLVSSTVVAPAVRLRPLFWCSRVPCT